MPKCLLILASSQTFEIEAFKVKEVHRFIHNRLRLRDGVLRRFFSSLMPEDTDIDVREGDQFVYTDYQIIGMYLYFCLQHSLTFASMFT